MEGAQQLVYPRAPGAYPAAAMQQWEGPPIMMHPAYGQWPPQMMHPGHMMGVPMHSAPGMAPQLTQVLLTQLKSRGQNAFFKTRLCNKWRAGTCPFGDKCTYAHGQHELRYIPPELLAQLEWGQHSQAAPGGATSPPQADAAAAAGEPQAPPPPQGRQQPGNFKTRLCIRFMQTGACSRGAACSFGHGYEDLRGVGGPLPPQHPPFQQQQQQMHLHQFQQQQLFYQQQQMYHQQQTQQMQLGARPRSSPRHRDGQRGGGGRGGGQQLERARGLSARLGVGDAAAAADGGALELAEAAERSGEVLKESAFSDSAEGL